MSRNLFAQFLELIPQAPLQVGTVTATDSGLITVELPGGGLLKARGSANLGEHVFVRDGVVEASAPNLGLEIIEI